MKIIFFIRSLEVGGAERQMANLAVNLHSRGHEISVVTMYDHGAIAEDLRRNDIRVFSLNKQHRWQFLRPLFRLRSLVKKIDPDVLHSYGPEVNIFALFDRLISGKYRLVWGVRNAGLNRKMYGRFEQLLYKAECRLSKIPELIIANSDAGKKLSVTDGFSPERLVVIKNGIDTEKNYPDLLLRKAQRTKWAVDDKKKVIGLIGRIDPQKDHKNFISAIAQLPDQQKEDIKVVCAGYRNETQISDLRAFARDLQLEEKFIWEKHDRRVVKILNGLDILISASNAEGFSNILAEGLAVGLPCVATDVGDSKSIVREFGLIVPAADPAALSSAITEVLANPAFFSNVFAQTAREHIVRNFSVEALGQRTETALKAII